MKTTRKNIAQLAASLAGDPAAENGVRSAIVQNSLVSHLLSLRVSRGLTQEDVAKSMRCDPSKISRLESGDDTNLKWVDVVLYSHALELDMQIVFDDKNKPATEHIKLCIFKIMEDLQKLTKLAEEVGANDDIAKKIHQFNGEVLLNFFMNFQDNYTKLKSVMSYAPATIAEQKNRAQAEDEKCDSSPPMVEAGAAI